MATHPSSCSLLVDDVVVNQVSKPATIADLPVDLVRQIVSQVDGIQLLRNRASIAVTNKAFASAVRLQRHVEFSPCNPSGAGPLFSTASVHKLQSLLKDITMLQIVDVSMETIERMTVVAYCCPRAGLKWSFQKTCDQNDPRHISNCFLNIQSDKHASTRLRPAGFQPKVQLKVVDDKMYVDFGNPENMPDPQAGLALLSHTGIRQARVLAFGAAGQMQYNSLHLPPSSPQTDVAMLQRMSGLKLLHIGNQPLHAPFAGTIQGQLTVATAETFCQATAVHCTGLDEDIESLSVLEPMQSIKTWVSMSAKWQESKLLSQLAPNLEKLQLEFNIPCKTGNLPVHEITLGPALQSVDVTCVRDHGSVSIRGCSTNLKYMRLTARVIILESGLHVSLQSKQTTPLVLAEHRVRQHKTSVRFERAPSSSHKLVLVFGSQPSELV